MKMQMACYSLRKLFCLALVALSPFLVLALTSSDTNRVLVVYNSSWTQDSDGDGVQDSLQVANYYAAMHGIPTNHILGVATPPAPSLMYPTHTSFWTNLVVPIQNKLTELGPTNIDVILTVYGVPLKTYDADNSSLIICVDSCLAAVFGSTTNAQATQIINTYHDWAPGFDANPGHFSHAVYANYDGTPMYLVCRLQGELHTGGGLWDAINMLDQALYAQMYFSTNYYGAVGYVNSRYGPYTDAQLTASTAVQIGFYDNYADADCNISYAEHYIAAAGIGLRWLNDGKSDEIGWAGALWDDGTPALVATNAFLYGGWYNYARYNDAFAWLPGSVGTDLNSGSGVIWGDGAQAHGLTCMSGVVSEPYLDGNPWPNELLYYILQGYTYAEAAALATQYFNWQIVNCGDPLYAPFAPRGAPICDTNLPVFTSGYPYSTNVTLTQATVFFMVNSSAAQPKVVRSQVEYGTGGSYSQTNSTLEGFWRRNSLLLTNLSTSTTYHYRVKVWDVFGNTTDSSDATFTTANQAPYAFFTASATTGQAPFSVTFDGSGSMDSDGSVTNWAWAFGDGGQTSGVMAIVSHVYTNCGVYNAVLTAMDNAGATGSTNLPGIIVYPSSGSMIALQDGLNGYAGTADSYISTYFASETNMNFGGATNALSYYTNRHSLIRFDLSGFPTNAVITNATLSLYVYYKNYNALYWGVHRITTPWIEGTGKGSATSGGATWYSTGTGSPWITPGGDYVSTPDAEISSSSYSAANWLSLDVTSTVSNWVSGVYSNYGFMGIAENGSTLSTSWLTRECANQGLRPQLVVLYQSGSAVASNLRTVSVTTAGSGTGSVVLDPAGGTYLTGSVVTVTAIPGTNSLFTGWSGDLTGTNNPASLVVSDNANITANFRFNGCEILASAVGNGTISPSGAVAVAIGSSQSFVMTPATWYAVSNVMVDSVSAGALASYTFSNVSTDHMITASFSALLAPLGTPLWWLAQYGYTNNEQALDPNGTAVWKDYLTGVNPATPGTGASYNIIPYAEGFENLSGWGGGYARVMGAMGWSGDAAGDRSQITNLTYLYTATNLPLPAITHTNVLQLNTQGAVLTNSFGDGFNMSHGIVYLDMMMFLESSDNSPIWFTTADTGRKGGTYVNMAQQLVIYHGIAASDGSLVSNVLDVTSINLQSDSWHRVTWLIDATATNQGHVLAMFQLRLDGVAVTHTNAYGDNWKQQFQNTGVLPATGPGGTWFRFATTSQVATVLQALCFAGTGRLDDVVATTNNPFAPLSGTYLLVITRSGIGFSSLGTGSYVSASIAAGLNTQIIYTAADWNRISALSSNGAVMAAAVGNRTFTQTVLTISADLSNAVTFAAATPAQTGYTNIPTCWLTNWTEAAIQAVAGRDGFSVSDKYLLGLDPTSSNTYLLSIDSMSVQSGAVVIGVKRLATGALSPDGMHGSLVVQNADTLGIGFTNLPASAVTGATVFDGAGRHAYTNAINRTNGYYRAVVQ